MSKLREQLNKEIAEGKEIRLTSADVAAGRMISTKDDKQDTPANPAASQASVVVDASPSPGKDPLLTGGLLGDAGKNLTSTAVNNTGNERKAVDLTGASVMAKQVTIEPGTKAAFIDALIAGKRFKLPFNLFGKTVVGTLRNRSQAESLAIIARINKEIADKQINTGLEYATRLRNMLLAAQVETLNAESYPELKPPLMTVVEGADKSTPPGWLEQVTIWESKPEGLVSALYKQLIDFEQKYWTMVDNAGDQNFWNPAEST